MDDTIVNGLQARHKLIKSLHSHWHEGGITNFKNTWVECSPKVAAIALARAAFLTAKGIEESYGIEHLVCAAYLKKPGTVKHKWPIFPSIFP